MFGVSTPVDLARVMAENLLGEDVEQVIAKDRPSAWARSPT